MFVGPVVQPVNDRLAIPTVEKLSTYDRYDCTKYVDNCDAVYPRMAYIVPSIIVFKYE